MPAWAVAMIAAHGFAYFVTGLVIMFGCVSNGFIVLLEEQLMVGTKKSDIEADVAENPASHRLALRLAAYIMAFLGGLRMTIAVSGSCLLVIVLLHTYVSENIMLCNELVERRGIGWIACVFLLNLALVGTTAASGWDCLVL